MKEQSRVLFDELDLPATFSAKQEEDFITLHEHLPVMFPAGERLQHVVDHLPYVDPEHGRPRPTNIYTLEYLPFHLRDQVWLAHYAVTTVEDKIPQIDLKLNNALIYVCQSAYFQGYLNQFERNLVKAQLTYLAEHKAPNGLMPHNFPRQLRHSLHYTEEFRDAVCQSLTQFTTLQPHNVEMALERHAALWRPRAMEREFNNIYQINQGQIERVHHNHHQHALFRQAYHDAWVKNYLFEYYQRHQEVIDSLDQDAAPTLTPLAAKRVAKKLSRLQRRHANWAERARYHDHSLEK